jgi:uncharacterized membrane protein
MLFSMSKTTSKKLINSVTITAAMGALIIVMGLTHIGFIPWFSGASITIMQIPVLIAAIIAGLGSGIGTGLIFGIFSLIQAAIAPIGPLDPFFVNPLVSVLPRVLMGIGTFYCFKLFSSLPNFPKPVNYAISGLFGSLINTCLVLLMLVVIKAMDFKMFVAVLIANGLLEAVASAIITCIVVSLITMPKKKSKFSDA